MLSDTPADPTNVPPSPLTFETSSMPRLEAKLRRCFGPESSNTTTATRSWPIGWRPICRKALRSFVLHVLPGGALAGEPKPSDSPAYPGRRYLSKHRVRTTTHHRCRRGDSRRLADRETVPQPGRFQTTGESDLRSLSVKLQKNSCLARFCECVPPAERPGPHPLSCNHLSEQARPLLLRSGGKSHGPGIGGGSHG